MGRRRETRNLTVALPVDLLRKLKLLAAGRATSISALLLESLDELVHRESAYDRARRRALSSLARPRDLGFNGRDAETAEKPRER